MENNNEIDLMFLIHKIWSKRKRILFYGIIGLFCGIIVALSMPKEYVSQIELVLENNKQTTNSSAGALAGMLGVNLNNNSQSGVNEKLYPKVVHSTPFLVELANIEVVYKEQSIPFWKYVMYNTKTAWWKQVLSAPSDFISWIACVGEETKPLPDSLNTQELRLAFAGQLQTRIKIEFDSKSNIYSLSAKMQDPVISQVIVDSTFLQLGKYMTKYRTAKSAENLLQSTEMMKTAKNKYYNADSIYAMVADRNMNLISESAKIKVERAKNERELTFSVYQQLSTQVEMDRIRLIEDMPIATIIEPSYEPNTSLPNKKIIIIGFIFLSMFGYCCFIVVKKIVNKKE